MFQTLWNFAAKNTKGDRLSLICSGWLLSGFFVLLFCLLTARPFPYSIHGLVYLLASGAVNVIYVLLLEKVYHLSDFSMAYPLARGSGVLFTVFLAVLVGGEFLSTYGILGIALILLGISSVTWSGWKQKVTIRAILYCLIIGILAAIYALLDKFGVQTIDPVWYLGILNSLPALMLVAFYQGKVKIISFSRTHARDVVTIAVGATFSYVVILWALQFTQASYVVALREISIVFSALLGFLFLKEKFDFWRVLGILLMLSGVYLLRAA